MAPKQGDALPCFLTLFPLAATREATRGEKATPAEQERPLEVPSPSGPFQGMLRCRGEDEERLVRTIITGKCALLWGLGSSLCSRAVQG